MYILDSAFFISCILSFYTFKVTGSRGSLNRPVFSRWHQKRSEPSYRGLLTPQGIYSHNSTLVTCFLTFLFTISVLIVLSSFCIFLLIPDFPCSVSVALRSKWPIEKGYSLEGCDILIPALQEIIDQSSKREVNSYIIGMPRRWVQKRKITKGRVMYEPG